MSALADSSPKTPPLLSNAEITARLDELRAGLHLDKREIRQARERAQEKAALIRQLEDECRRRGLKLVIVHAEA